MASVQIPEELFSSLCNYFMLNPDSEELFNACKDGLQQKLDKMENRKLYSQSHDDNLSAKDQEQARQAYLDRKGIPEAFRW